MQEVIKHLKQAIAELQQAVEAIEGNKAEVQNRPLLIDVTAEKLVQIPYQQIVSLYHEILPELPKVRALSKQRKAFIKQRWLEPDGMNSLEDWRQYFRYVRGSRFLMGFSDSRDDRPPFQADLEWLIRPTNQLKVVEGKYHAKTKRA